MIIKEVLMDIWRLQLYEILENMVQYHIYFQ